MEISSDSRVFISGKTGSGKSFLLKKRIVPMLENVVVYDPKHEWETTGFGFLANDVVQLAAALQVSGGHILYQPVDDSDWCFDELCRLCFVRRNVVLVLDEVMAHCTAHFIPKYLDFIVRMGRKFNVGLIVCTQRPAIVHNNLIGNAEHFFLFRQQLEPDRRKLSHVIGEYAEKLGKLGKFEFLYYNPETGARHCLPVV